MLTKDVADEVAQMALDHVAAMSAAQSAVVLLMPVRVVEKHCRGQGYVDGTGRRNGGERIDELIAHVAEARGQ